MNILEVLKQEIKKLKITDKLTIARYIYLRTGELFIYDPAYKYGKDLEKEKSLQKRINIKNVSDFKITCSSWSYLYCDLLKNFKINAEVIEEYNYFPHAYVKIKIDGFSYKADITIDKYKDLIAIKNGLETEVAEKVYKITVNKDSNLLF